MSYKVKYSLGAQQPRQLHGYIYDCLRGSVATLCRLRERPNKTAAAPGFINVEGLGFVDTPMMHMSATDRPCPAYLTAPAGAHTADAIHSYTLVQHGSIQDYPGPSQCGYGCQSSVSKVLTPV